MSLRCSKQTLGLNVNSLQREKYKDTELCFAVALHKGFRSFIHLLSKTGRHLGTYQRKAGAIKLTVFFPRRLNLHLRYCLSCQASKGGTNTCLN